MTGPDQLKACKWELEADTEKFIQTIEVRCRESASFSIDCLLVR